MPISREAQLNLNILVDLGDGGKAIDALKSGIVGLDEALQKTRKGFDDLRNTVKPLETKSPQQTDYQQNYSKQNADAKQLLGTLEGIKKAHQAIHETRASSRYLQSETERAGRLLDTLREIDAVQQKISGGGQQGPSGQSQPGKGPAPVSIFSQAARWMGGILHMQDGGIVPGPSVGDRVPALLEGGEGVVPARVMRHFASGTPKRKRKSKEQREYEADVAVFVAKNKQRDIEDNDYINSGKAPESFERENHRLPYEYARLELPESEKLKGFSRVQEFRGTRFGVDLSGVDNMAGEILSHNHPDGDSFSVKDILSARSGGLKEIRATTPIGDVHSLKALEGWPSEGALRRHIAESVQSSVTMDQAKLPREEQIKLGLMDKVWNAVASKPIVDGNKEYRLDYAKGKLSHLSSGGAFGTPQGGDRAAILEGGEAVISRRAVQRHFAEGTPPESPLRARRPETIPEGYQAGHWSKYPVKAEFTDDDKDRLEVTAIGSLSYKDQVFEQNAGRASFKKMSDGTWRAMSVHVPDEFQKKGIAADLGKAAVEQIGPFLTSRVFSKDGALNMKGLVKRGLAEQVGADDFRIHYSSGGAFDTPGGGSVTSSGHDPLLTPFIYGQHTNDMSIGDMAYAPRVAKMTDQLASHQHRAGLHDLMRAVMSPGRLAARNLRGLTHGPAHYADGGIWGILKGAGRMASSVWNDKGGIEAALSEKVLGAYHALGRRASDGLQSAINWGDERGGKRVGGAAQSLGAGISDKWQRMMGWIDRGPTYEDVDAKVEHGIGEAVWHGKDVARDLFHRAIGRHFDEGGEFSVEGVMRQLMSGQMSASAKRRRALGSSPLARLAKMAHIERQKSRGDGPQLDFEPPRDWDPNEPSDDGPGDVWNPRRPRTPTPDYSMHFAEGGAYSALMRRLMGQRGNMGESDPITDTGAAVDDWASHRYGPKTWKAHGMFGQAATWLASPLTMMATGYPLPFGTGVATGLATAEAHRMLKQVFGGKHMAHGGESGPTITDKHGKVWSVTQSLMNEKPHFAVHEPDAPTGVWAGSAHVSAKGNKISSVGVYKEFQRRGIASALYDHIEKTLGYELQPNWAQTDDGQALWAARFARKQESEAPKFSTGGRADMTRGGVVPQMSGVTPGSDWHPAWLTDEEHVINARSARKHRRLLEAINADHYAIGGTAPSRFPTAGPLPTGFSGPVMPSWKSQGAQMVHVVNFNEMPISANGSGNSGVAGGNVAPDTGLSKLEKAAVAASAAIGLFHQVVHGATGRLEIMGDAFLTDAQKTRMSHESINPLAAGFNRLGEAIDGTLARIARSNAETDKAINTQQSEHKAQTATLALGRGHNQYIAAAYGMRSVGIERGESVFANTPHGDIMAHEQDVRLEARDAVINQQRIVAGSAEAVRLQYNRVGTLSARSAQSDAATRQAQAAARTAQQDENIVRPMTTGQRTATYMSAAGGGALIGAGIGGTIGSIIPGPGTVAGALIGGAIGGGIGLAGAGLHHAFGSDTAQRMRDARTIADNRESVAMDRSDNDLLQLGQARRDLQRDRLDLQKQENEQAKIAVGIQQAELQLMQERSARMRQDVSRLGSMSRGEYRQAQRSMQILQRRGQEGFERAPQGMIQQASRIDPRAIERMQRVLGEQRAQREVGAGRVDETMQRDWQGGNARLGDTLTRERDLAQTIRQQLSEIGQQSSDNIARAFEQTMQGMADVIQRTMLAMQARWEHQFRQIQNNR